MKYVAGALWVAASMVGCAGDTTPLPLDPLTLAATPEGTIPIAWPTLAVSPDTTPAADPKLPGADGFVLAFDAAFHTTDGRTCVIIVGNGAAEIARIEADATADQCRTTWDGRAATGAFVPPGEIEVVGLVLSSAGEEMARAETTIEVVRLGISSIALAAATGTRVPLLYRAVDEVRTAFHELPSSLAPFQLAPDSRETADAVDIERADGTPREQPAPWADLASPPIDRASVDDVERETYNLPAAFVAGATLEITATLSASVAGAVGGGEPVATEIRVVPPEGTTIAGSDAFAHGAELTVTTDESPVPSVARYDLSLEWRFEARRPGEEWVPVPGSLTTTHRLYGLAGTPVFDYTSVPHRAWVDVVDLVTGWVDGATSDPMEVAGRIVEGVYNDLGLRYDRDRGASFYTDYPGTWADASFDASWFQDRSLGSTINCSDAASIVSTYANMMGVDLRYHILEHSWDSGFDLNYIQSIGWPGFTETPFTGGRGGFRYHAVVGPADGSFYDATLALDGDGTPTAPPHMLLLAQGMDPSDYKRALSSVWMDVVTSMDEKVRIR